MVWSGLAERKQMKINFGSGCGEELARPMATHQSNRSELDLVLIELRASH